jgi:hypothetical protein
MSLTWLLERVRRPGVPSLRTVDALGARLRFRTFDEFIERWVWKCGFLDEYRDVESLAQSVLEGLPAEGVVRVEPSFLRATPRGTAWRRPG